MTVSMDFMTHLPESKGFDSIMVVVDRVSKMSHFVPTRDTATAQEVGRLYFNKVVKHHGMQKNIISNRDPKFTSRFWRALWKKLDTELKMSTAFRPQTDGQNGTSELGFAGVLAKLRECGPNGLGRLH